MKAIGFNQPLPISDERSLVDIELPDPEPGPNDLLVAVEAIAVNPADTKVRASARPASSEGASHPYHIHVNPFQIVSIIDPQGRDVSGFRVGDRVFHAGAIDRPGCYAQLQTVDARIAAHVPEGLSNEDAAALPLTTLTGWETLFDRLDVQRPVTGAAPALLVIGGAGGVGSITIQLARALTRLTVIATASRPESVDWVKRMGAHHVIDHSRPLAPQVSALGIGAPAFVFCTSGIDRYLPDIVELIAPQGRIAMIDDPETLDIVPLKRKSLTISWEFMFTRSLLGTADIARQGEILRELGDLVTKGKVRSTRTETLGRINAQNLRWAHERLEGGRTLGKLVLAGW